jgi:hypothetical protein
MAHLLVYMSRKNLDDKVRLTSEHLNFKNSKLFRPVSVITLKHCSGPKKRNLLYTSEFDRLCGLVVRVSGYRSRGPGFDSRLFQIF